MSVYLFSMDASPALSFADDRSAKAVAVLGLEALKSHRPERRDLSYIDLRGLDVEAGRKAVQTLRRRCSGSSWGVFDPEGTVADPAALFFAGASDYIGPAVIRAGVDAARFKAALASTRRRDSTAEGEAEAGSLAAAGCADGAPEGGFGGWKAIRPGSSYPFCFVYATASSQANLKTSLGEAGYVAFRDRLRHIMQQGLAEADALLWMETDSSALYLVPPYAANASAAIEFCLRTLLGAPLIGYERLCLPFPLDFTFAIHSGTTEFEPPGKTGNIVSEAVNFSYHLGVKRAEPGRVTISADAAGLAVPGRFSDLFVPAGSFEGRSIFHSRRFWA